MLKRIICTVLVLVQALTAWPEDLKTVMSYYQPDMTRGFIFISKTDMTLTLVDSLGRAVATYPMACGRNIGPKTVKGDNKTPEGYFLLQNIHESSSWGHDFHDGKGFIRNAYGPYFLRLQTGFNGIGIHGTHAPESIGTRASEGCIRLENNNVAALRQKVKLGMPVIIGPEKGVKTLIASNTPRPSRMVWAGDKKPRTTSKSNTQQENKVVLKNKPVVVEGQLEIDPEKDLEEVKTTPVETVEESTIPVEPVQNSVEETSGEALESIETPVEAVETVEAPANAVDPEQAPVEVAEDAETAQEEESTGELEYEVVVEEVAGPDGEIKFEVRYVPVRK